MDNAWQLLKDTFVKRWSSTENTSVWSRILERLAWFILDLIQGRRNFHSTLNGKKYSQQKLTLTKSLIRHLRENLILFFFFFFFLYICEILLLLILTDIVYSYKFLINEITLTYFRKPLSPPLQITFKLKKSVSFRELLVAWRIT